MKLSADNEASGVFVNAFVFHAEFKPLGGEDVPELIQVGDCRAGDEGSHLGVGLRRYS